MQFHPRKLPFSFLILPGLGLGSLVAWIMVLALSLSAQEKGNLPPEMLQPDLVSSELLLAEKLPTPIMVETTSELSVDTVSLPVPPPTPAVLAFPTADDVVSEPARPTDEEVHRDNLRRFRAGEELDWIQASRQALWAGDMKSATLFAGESLERGQDTCESLLIQGQSCLWGGKRRRRLIFTGVFFGPVAGGPRKPSTSMAELSRQKNAMPKRRPCILRPSTNRWKWRRKTPRTRNGSG